MNTLKTIITATILLFALTATQEVQGQSSVAKWESKINEYLSESSSWQKGMDKYVSLNENGEVEIHAGLGSGIFNICDCDPSDNGAKLYISKGDGIFLFANYTTRWGRSVTEYQVQFNLGSQNNYEPYFVSSDNETRAIQIYNMFRTMKDRICE